MAVVHGCEGPELEKLIKEKLEQEHKVLNGEGERVAVSELHIYCTCKIYIHVIHLTCMYSQKPINMYKPYKRKVFRHQY